MIVLEIPKKKKKIAFCRCCLVFQVVTSSNSRLILILCLCHYSTLSIDHTVSLLCMCSHNTNFHRFFCVFVLKNPKKKKFFVLIFAFSISSFFSLDLIWFICLKHTIITSKKTNNQWSLILLSNIQKPKKKRCSFRFSDFDFCCFLISVFESLFVSSVFFLFFFCVSGCITQNSLISVSFCLIWFDLMIASLRGRLGLFFDDSNVIINQ